MEDDATPHSTYQVSHEEDDVLTAEALDSLVQAGAEDALVLQQFENEFE